MRMTLLAITATLLMGCSYFQGGEIDNEYAQLAVNIAAWHCITEIPLGEDIATDIGCIVAQSYMSEPVPVNFADTGWRGAFLNNAFGDICRNHADVVAVLLLMDVSFGLDCVDRRDMGQRVFTLK